MVVTDDVNRPFASPKLLDDKYGPLKEANGKRLFAHAPEAECGAVSIRRDK